VQTQDNLKHSEGCILAGSLDIHKVPGTLFISSHDFEPAWQKLFLAHQLVSMEHTINHFSFGRQEQADQAYSAFGVKPKNELSRTTVLGQAIKQHMIMDQIQYKLDITQLEYQEGD